MIRVGVTGHRSSIELAKIDAGIDEALIRIQQLFPGEPLTVVSALAEGADRSVARKILGRPDGQLIAALPLPRADYITDFKSEESRAEFVTLLEQALRVIEFPKAPTREKAYEAASEYVVNNSDVLIAVWDGLDALGRGGTAQIVLNARRRGLPNAWIHAGNRNPLTNKPVSLGNEQGMVTFENL